MTALTVDSFNGVGDNIKPYRYLVMNTADIQDATVNEVYNIIQQTKIPWREIETGDIVVKVDNKIIYQNVEVSITARYPLPQIFGNFGLPTEFNYTVSAVTAVNDPDEFIRNVDLIVDVCASIDQKTGGNIQKVLAKLNDMGTRLTQFLSGEKGIGGSGGTGTNPAGGSRGGNENNYIADAGEVSGAADDTETGEDGESGNAGEGNSEGGTEIAGNITPGNLGFIYVDQGEEESPKESSDTSDEGTAKREEVTPPAPWPSSTPEPDVEESNVAKETGIINKQIEIIDSKGKCLGEFDEIDLDNKIFYEDKSAKGLGTINPKTGKPSQTPQEFADKQIYTKTMIRINNLMNATGTREAKTNIVDNVPNISELQDIKKFVFRFDGDSPELRTAVENSILKLQSEFPDYSFEAIFGND